jgi:hypothetical protein
MLAATATATATANAAGPDGWPSSLATRTVTSYLLGGLLMPGTVSVIYNIFGVRWPSPAHDPPTRSPACPARPRAPAHGGARRLASSGPALLGQDEAQIAEPGTGDPDPFPAVRGLGSCGDVRQGRVQLGQFQAPLGSGVKVSAGGGLIEQPFGFAVVIWTVH